MVRLSRLKDFVKDMASLVTTSTDDGQILTSGADLLSALVSSDDWLPDEFAQPDHSQYRQYLLHCDSLERFSIVSFVWGPGQSTPIHDHTVWGLVGVLRGSELSEGFIRDPDGTLHSRGAPRRLDPGEVERLLPATGDIHRVANRFNDRPSISIHVYGANIGAVQRSTFALDGKRKEFISGYSNICIPNIWDCSRNDSL